MHAPLDCMLLIINIYVYYVCHPHVSLRWREEADSSDICTATLNDWLIYYYMDSTTESCLSMPPLIDLDKSSATSFSSKNAYFA
jgi:hypothetical protein